MNLFKKIFGRKKERRQKDEFILYLLRHIERLSRENHKLKSQVVELSNRKE